MISQLQYQNFLNQVLEVVEGDWVLIGGSLLVLLKSDFRATADIDICPIGELTNIRRLELMKLAENSGLDIESVNPAADFFLRQIPNWQSSIIPLFKGKKGTLFRPSLELYFRLKSARLTESDLNDCEVFFKWHIENNVEFDPQVLLDFLRNGQTQEQNLERKRRLDRLIVLIAQDQKK